MSNMPATLVSTTFNLLKSNKSYKNIHCKCTIKDKSNTKSIINGILHYSDYDIKETYIGPGVDTDGYHGDTRPNGYPVYTRSQSYTQLAPDNDSTQVVWNCEKMVYQVS